jgi:hypothetical protein
MTSSATPRLHRLSSASERCAQNGVARQKVVRPPVVDASYAILVRFLDPTRSSEIA